MEECLRQRTSRELYEAHVRGNLSPLSSLVFTLTDLTQSAGSFSSRPNIDSFSLFPSVVPADPVALLSEGNMSKVPVLIGSNSGEGILNAGDYIKR